MSRPLQVTAARDKGVICKNYFDSSSCAVVNCPYAHFAKGTELPTPKNVCQYHETVKCKKDDCRFFHGNSADFLKLRRTNAPTYRPEEYMPVKDPLDLSTSSGVSNEPPPMMWPPPVPLPVMPGAPPPRAAGSGSSVRSWEGGLSSSSQQGSGNIVHQGVTMASVPTTVQQQPMPQPMFFMPMQQMAGPPPPAPPMGMMPFGAGPMSGPAMGGPPPGAFAPMYPMYPPHHGMQQAPLQTVFLISPGAAFPPPAPSC